MRRWAAAFLLLALATTLAALALRPPTARQVEAPPAAFSAGRALADVRAIAQGPHPMGSPAQARVQAYLLARMTSLGLSPQAQPFVSAKGPGVNLLGVLPGRDRTAPVLLLMAHTDSVPAGPGAADDGAGVAAVLETVRALRAQPRQRDVMVLLTDGEELGTLGAHAFFASDPARAQVGIVINLEARGDRGRAVMFETHAGAGPLVALLTRAGALSGASSLMPDLYRRLPNGTDLTEAIAAGRQGLNFAFFSGFDAYHSALDTAARLDPGTLQDIGDKVLKAAMVLASAPALPVRAPDQTYADILGGPILVYPAWAGWVLIVLAAGGVSVHALRLAQSRRLSLWGVAAGAGAFLLLLVVIAAALYGLGRLRIDLAAHHLAPLLRHGLAALTGAGLLAAGAALVWTTLAARWLSPESLTLGAAKIVGLGAVLLQILAPLDAFILAWPFALIGLALALGGPRRPWASWAILLAATAQVFYWARLYFDLIGQVTPAALTPFAALAIAVLLPVVPKLDRRAGWAGAGLAVAGAALSLAALAP
jgi:hypothetical protein